MSELVFGYDAEIARWVIGHIPHMRGGDFGPCAAIGVASKNKLLAGIVYHDYQPDFRTIQLSMASEGPMWARRSTIAALLHYPFEQLGVYKVWTLTPIDNEAALRVNQHIGFKKEATLAHQFGPKRHGVVCRLTKQDYNRKYAHG